MLTMVQHWRLIVALAVGSTDDGAILTMGSTCDNGQHWRWAALTMGSTDDGQH